MSMIRFSSISPPSPQALPPVPRQSQFPQLNESHEKGQGDTQVVERIEVRIPKLHKVIMHNDDYTTMEFVIGVLKRFFHKSEEEAQSLMMKVHQEGHAICGIFTKEIAETKVIQVTRYAKENGHPLRISMEEE